MKIVQSRYLYSLLDQRATAVRGGLARGQRRDARNVVANRGAANGFFIVEGFAAQRRIDDQIDLAGLDEVNDIGPAFVYFEDAFGFDACSVQSSSGAASGGELKTH